MVDEHPIPYGERFDSFEGWKCRYSRSDIGPVPSVALSQAIDL